MVPDYLIVMLLVQIIAMVAYILRKNRRNK